MKQAYLVFEIGSLQVYTMQEPSFVGYPPAWAPGSPTDNYYWRDKASPQGYGPFLHITAAMEHYKWLIQTCKGNGPLLLDGKLEVTAVRPVIRLDFKSKKRVISDV